MQVSEHVFKHAFSGCDCSLKIGMFLQFFHHNFFIFKDTALKFCMLQADSDRLVVFYAFLNALTNMSVVDFGTNIFLAKKCRFCMKL